MPATLNSLLDQLEDADQLTDPDALYLAFSRWAQESGRPLYPHQEQALLELLSGNHVIAQTPTGSGKSLMALAAHFISLARGGRSFYTAPLKALVSEKFFDLVDAFGAHNVGMITGDVSLNPQAPIICCTAEILANQSLREGRSLDTDMVIMDEFHFYGDPQRGWAWQIPLLQLPKPQFLALSATLGDTADLAADLTERTGRDVTVISDAERPVPLEYEYCVDDLPTVVQRLLQEGRAPIYVVHFAQREAVATAKALEKIKLIDKEQKAQILRELEGENFGRGFGQTLRGLLLHGIGIHHAGMLPRYRRLVERLTQRGLLKVVCGTDTLGVGINVPIRTVLFTSLVKFDGNRMRHLSAREFHQIAGRAGRAGYDTVGFVRALATDNEIEQAKRQARQNAAQEAADRKKLKKLARKGPSKAEPGRISWTRATFERLVDAEPEVLASRFTTNHALFLNVLAGDEDPEQRLLHLATTNHDAASEANRHLRDLGDIYRSLLQAGVITRVSASQAETDGRPQLRAAQDLPDDFALNQPLAPFALAALELLDPDSPTFALDVVSVIEAIVDDPRPLLWAQERRARDRAMQEMKADGVEYDDRMAALQEITWPRPLAETLMPAFQIFAATNPWVRGLEPSPKSVVREMVESAQTFSGLVSSYDLANAEGVVLRYLTDVYKALIQIPPAKFQTEEVQSLTKWLGDLVRSVDSSLLDEWETLASGQASRTAQGQTSGTERAFGENENGRIDYTKNLHALRRRVRQEIFHIVEAVAKDDVDGLARINAPFAGEHEAQAWDADQWDHALGRYWAEHDWVATGQAARGGDYYQLAESPTAADLQRAGNFATTDDIPQTSRGDLGWWLVKQTLLDPDDTRAWRIQAFVDVAASQESGQPQIRVVSFDAE